MNHGVIIFSIFGGPKDRGSSADLKRRRRMRGVALGLLAVLLLVPSLLAQGRDHRRASRSDEFFIVSSVDPEKQQLLLKHPTEVTELMLVTNKSVYLDEQGKPVRFSDFRAGDTVYVTSVRSGSGPRVAARIRKGMMTVEELRRRYGIGGRG